MNIKKIIRIIFHPIERHNEKSKVSEDFHDVELMPIILDPGTSNRVHKFNISKINWGTTIKIVSLICIVGFFFILPTFADNTTNGTLKSTQELLEKFLSLCSRGWIVLAILAGKLMTNDFVYGAFIHMDIYLWKIRNIMKNFANFALIGLVLFSIVKSLVGKTPLDLKKIITNTLVAGILIQASRFLMGAVIDLSTVATASIGAFPISFLKTDQSLQGNIKATMDAVQKLRPVIDLTTGGNNTVRLLQEPNPSTTTRENILPDQNSVSGPFIYLGMGVFNFQNYLSTESTTGLTNLTLGFALRFFLLFLFTVGLLLLVIANIMRVGLLRIFIIGSPFLILIQVFSLKTGESTGKLGKLFSLSNLIAIAFKPVIFVAGMSLMLIVIVSMQNGITGSGATRENDLNGVVLGTTGAATSTLSVEGISNISVNQTDILGKDVVKHGQNFFSQLIMLLLTIFLMRRFIKLSLTMGGGPIEETMKRLTGLAESFAKSAPILPGGGGFTAAKSFMSEHKAKTLGGFGLNKAGEFGEMKGKDFTTNEDKFSKFINNKLDLQAPWTGNDYDKLNKIAGNQTDYINFFDQSQALAKERERGLSVNDTQWMKSVQVVLSKPSNIAAINKKLDYDKQFTSPWTQGEAKDYFANGNNAKALYGVMGGEAASGVTAPANYEDLTKITFHASKE